MNPASPFVSLGEFTRVRQRGYRTHGACALLLALACMPARAAPTCTVAANATLSFGTIVALAGSGDVTANSGTSLWVSCTSDVAAAPSLYSGTPRVLVSGGNSLPFALSAIAPGGAELPTASPGATLGILRNGTQQTVTLYGKVAANNFRALPSGSYATLISLTIEY